MWCPDKFLYLLLLLFIFNIIFIDIKIIIIIIIIIYMLNANRTMDLCKITCISSYVCMIKYHYAKNRA